MGGCIHVCGMAALPVTLVSSRHPRLKTSKDVGRAGSVGILLNTTVVLFALVISTRGYRL